MKLFLGGLALALFLLVATSPGEAAQEQPVPVTVPERAATLDELPRAPAVPLEISETTPPPGWVHPDDRMPEQVLVELLGEGWAAARWQLVGVLVALAILAAIVVGFEKSRYR